MGHTNEGTSIPLQAESRGGQWRKRKAKPDVENWKSGKDSFSKKVIWNLSQTELNSAVGQEFSDRVSGDEI